MKSAILDHRRGFDVYKWAPQAAEAGSVPAGRWLDAGQALKAARQLGDAAVVGGVCILRR